MNDLYPLYKSDLIVPPQVSHSHQAKDLPPLGDAVHAAPFGRRHHDPLFDAGVGRVAIRSGARRVYGGGRPQRQPQADGVKHGRH